jgi:nucleoside-diphosphate-sugar epimerase
LKVLVTGATGFLGSHVVEGVVAAGHAVRSFARTAPRAAVEHVSGDVLDREAIRRALGGMEVVLHLAGRVSRDPKEARAMYALHVDGTRIVLEEAKAAGVRRVVLASSSGTIAVSREDRVGTEADDYPIEVVGRWPYYTSKIYQEKLALQFCKANGIPLVVLNPSLLLGPGDDRVSSTGDVVSFLQRDIPAMPRGGLSFVDVRDAADAFVAAIDRGEVQGRHLLGVNMSLAEFFGRLERLTGVPAPKVRLPTKANLLGVRVLEKWAKVRGAEPPIDRHSVEMGECFFYLDASKAERELGFRARDPHETLHDTVQHLLSTMPPGHLPGIKGALAELRDH